MRLKLAPRPSAHTWHALKAATRHATHECDEHIWASFGPCFVTGTLLRLDRHNLLYLINLRLSKNEVKEALKYPFFDAVGYLPQAAVFGGLPPRALHRRVECLLRGRAFTLQHLFTNEHVF